MTDLHKADAEFAQAEQAKADDLLTGRRIKHAEAVTKYDRTEKLILWLDNGTQVHVSYWASYADDASLEFGPGERDE